MKSDLNLYFNLLSLARWKKLYLKNCNSVLNGYCNRFNFFKFPFSFLPEIKDRFFFYFFKNYRNALFDELCFNDELSFCVNSMFCVRPYMGQLLKDFLLFSKDIQMYKPLPRFSLLFSIIIRIQKSINFKLNKFFPFIYKLLFGLKKVYLKFPLFSFDRIVDKFIFNRALLFISNNFNPLFMREVLNFKTKDLFFRKYRFRTAGARANAMFIYELVNNLDLKDFVSKYKGVFDKVYRKYKT